MSRRLHDLTLENLDHLPAACRACVFWEVAGSAQGPHRDPAAGRSAKEAWWQATQLEWGAPGKACYSDDELVAYAAFAPGRHYPRSRRLGPAVSDDALLLAVLWVREDQREAGIAKVLLQAVLRETHRFGGRALEAYGWRGAGNPNCLIPESFLLANGFAVVEEHDTTPLLRLELRQTARESVHHALETVLSALSGRERARAPAPVQRSLSPP